MITDSGIWVPSTSAFTRVHSPTGVNALQDALCAGTTLLVRVLTFCDREAGMRLKDKVAIVTGAAHGIGLAIARRYVAEGARVTIADIDAAAGEAEAHALRQARFVPTDVGDAGNAENVVAETCRAFGDLDILVNNAGIIHGADFLDLTKPISTACCG